MEGLNDIKELAISHYGVKLCDYLEVTLDDVGHRWSWCDFIFLNEDMRSRITEALHPRNIVITSEEDTTIQCAAKSGEYSTKLGYLVSKLDKEKCPYGRPTRTPGLCWPLSVSSLLGFCGYNGSCLLAMQLRLPMLELCPGKTWLVGSSSQQHWQSVSMLVGSGKGITMVWSLVLIPNNDLMAYVAWKECPHLPEFDIFIGDCPGQARNQNLRIS
ncbi:hypothetical protein SUGI_0354940 [Cryptomeria japonica]|nr:hypothetical protein SUGI_0354940 [Cryptomeria japonica]